MYEPDDKALDARIQGVPRGGGIYVPVKSPVSLHWVRVSRREVMRLISDALEADDLCRVVIADREDGKGSILVDLVDLYYENPFGWQYHRPS